MANHTKEEPKTAPQPDRWYDLVLGPSFDDQSTNKYCTLRYDFKPASIDKTKPGTLQKNKENRVSVDFQNNQLGKPKVAFEGSCEDYRDNDAVLFFDGEGFRLERLHRAVKQLRLLRQPGESAAIAAAAAAAVDRLSPVGKSGKQVHTGRNNNTSTVFPAVPVEVERIDVGEPPISGAKVSAKGISDHPADPPNVAASPSPKNDEAKEHYDIDIEDLFGVASPEDANAGEQKADDGSGIIAPHQNDSDDEIADVDDSGDEGDKGRNAAEALRAQVNAEERDDGQTSSSSSSSGSGSSGSGSGSGGSSSSSDSDKSDEDSVNSI